MVRRHILKSFGFTLVEILVSLTIIAVMASVAMPMIQVTLQRQKEQMLRSNLREIRHAIDAYKKAVDEGHIKKNSDASGYPPDLLALYPPDLLALVEGVEDAKDPKHGLLRFLRRIPVDPMLPRQTVAGVSELGWGLRSYDTPYDQPRYTQDVYDIYSLSSGVGLNGIPYAQW